MPLPNNNGIAGNGDYGFVQGVEKGVEKGVEQDIEQGVVLLRGKPYTEQLYRQFWREYHGYTGHYSDE